MPEQIGYLCDTCRHLATDLCQGKVYECQNCSKRFVLSDNSTGHHHCPECNKFSSKVKESKICAECYSDDVEEFNVVNCNLCDELMLLDDYQTHLEEEYASDLAEFYVKFVPIIDAINV